ncbi:carboxypeptidase-like regulatory domain-containing protein [Flavobacterium sp. UBA7682]|uniref:carboxypeptidase-like regulatory domain-containing protein n=1 Tax=Flavobacterium sp. UBA7682 TaxID=1946560 RepID=UPI0025B873ED|nr:carboxypeptidase-like regulatory domain-containing protein [Flavobacterium sp. UBA7682]
MSNKINISIPQPCHENWEAMTAVDKGKFCASCQKKVHDFTKASDREIVTAFQQNQNLCGRFLNTQLDRDLVKTHEKSSIWLATTATIISLIGLGTQESFAQGSAKIEQTDKKVLGDRDVVAKNEEIEISGIVSDSIGPLPGANIVVKGTKISTQADLEGKYTILAKKGDILIFSFVGYTNVTLPITGEMKIINTKMKDSVTLQGEVIFIKKRTFFGRIFHSIGNWFR